MVDGLHELQMMNCFTSKLAVPLYSFKIISKMICWEEYDMVCWFFFLSTIKQEEGVGITCNSLDPGPVATDFMRHHSIVNGKPLSL